jgi:hypothetical protein
VLLVLLLLLLLLVDLIPARAAAAAAAGGGSNTSTSTIALEQQVYFGTQILGMRLFSKKKNQEFFPACPAHQTAALLTI